MTNPSFLKHPTAKLVSLMVLLAGLPVALYLVFNAVRLWPKAQVAPVQFSFAPSSASLPPNQTLDLRLDAATNRIGFVHVELTFDQTKVNLANEITVTNALKTVVTKTTRDQANATGRVVVAAGIDPADIPNAPTGVFSFASLSFMTVSTVQNDTAHVAFDQPRLETFDIAEARLSSAASDATLTLNPTGGGGARLFFSPSPVSLPPNRSVELRLDSGSERIVFVHAEFTFNASKVNLSGEITTTTQLGTVVQKTTAGQANSSGRVVVALALDTTQVGSEPSGNFLLATIPLTAVSSTPNDQDTLQFTTTEVVNTATQALTVTTENGTINLNTGGGTPTRTPTPSRTPTPTRTPTPSRTPTPGGPTLTPTPTGTQCLQVLTPARCTDGTQCTLNECQTFPTSCLPSGWTADPSCAATPTPTPTGGATLTPSPTPTTDPTKTTLTIKIRLQGITVQANDQMLRFTFVWKGPGSVANTVATVLATNGADGVYTATIPNILPGTYDIYVKSGSHLQRKFPNVTLDPGAVVLDLTNIVSF